MDTGRVLEIFKSFIAANEKGDPEIQRVGEALAGDLASRFKEHQEAFDRIGERLERGARLTAPRRPL